MDRPMRFILPSRPPADNLASTDRDFPPLRSIKHATDATTKDEQSPQPASIPESTWSAVFSMSYKKFCDEIITPPVPFFRTEREWELLETALENVYGNEEGQKFLKDIREREKEKEKENAVEGLDDARSKALEYLKDMRYMEKEKAWLLQEGMKMKVQGLLNRMREKEKEEARKSSCCGKEEGGVEEPKTDMGTANLGQVDTLEAALAGVKISEATQADERGKQEEDGIVEFEEVVEVEKSTESLDAVKTEEAIKTKGLTKTREEPIVVYMPPNEPVVKALQDQRHLVWRTLDDQEADFYQFYYESGKLGYRVSLQSQTHETFCLMARRKAPPGRITKNRNPATNSIRWKRKAAARVIRMKARTVRKMAQMDEEKEGRNRKEADDIVPNYSESAEHQPPKKRGIVIQKTSLE